MQRSRDADGDQHRSCADRRAFPTPDALLHAADAALYRAKRPGRGRTEIAATDDLAGLDVRFV